MSATLPMPLTDDCCSTPCDEIAPSQVPGPQGEPGDDGADGADGVNAFTLTTAGFTQPASAANVTVAVADSEWMVVGQKVFVQVGGYYDVVSKPTSLSVILKNLGYTGNAAPAVVIAGSSPVSPGGIKGTDGTNGSSAAFPTTTKGDLIVDTGTLNPLADPARFAVGSDGKMLVADNAQALGVGWKQIHPNAASDNGIPRFDGATGLPIPVQTSNLIITDDGSIQSTPSGGNARGSKATDLQVDRSAATQVANGANSVIAGGLNNTASGQESIVTGGKGNTASAVNSTVGGGLTNTASGADAVVAGGFSNGATADNATVGGGETNLASSGEATVSGGGNNTASAFGATVPGGGNNIASGPYSMAHGRNATANKYAQDSQSSGYLLAQGDAQTSVLVARYQTGNALATEIYLDGVSERITIADNTTWMFSIFIVARRADVDGESAAYKLEGCLDRNVGVATTALVGSVTKTVLAEDTAAWDVAASADAVNGSLKIEVTGEASKDIAWTARVTLVEVTA